MSINLDDSDDDLDLPPPTTTNGAGGGAGNQHKDPISLDTDDDDEDLPPSGSNVNSLTVADSIALPAKNAANVDLDDDDDDLPPPSKSAFPPVSNVASKQSPASPTTAKAPTTAARGKQQAAPLPAGSPTTQNLDVTRNRSATIAKQARRTISDTTMESYLFKQSPSWPHTLQKRWVTLKGRLLSYYEEKSSSAPSGTIDLKGAQIIDNPQTKSPHALGITGDTPSLKGRVFIFTASSRDEYLGWLEVLKFVTTEPKNSEIHWFEKMAQGLY